MLTCRGCDRAVEILQNATHNQDAALASLKLITALAILDDKKSKLEGDGCETVARALCTHMETLKRQRARVG
jgi:hypothetical protein